MAGGVASRVVECWKAWATEGNTSSPWPWKEPGWGRSRLWQGGLELDGVASRGQGSWRQLANVQR